MASQPKRGRRRAPKIPVYRRRTFVLPILVLVLGLGVGPAASGWVTESSQPRTTLGTPKPTPAAAQPTTTVTPAPFLGFATWNIAKSTNRQVPSWSKRRLAIARTINESGSDVIALQEATQHPVKGVGGKTMSQWSDVKALTKKGGYVATKVETDSCARNKCIHSGHILFKKSTIKQLDFPGKLPSAGQGRLSEIASGLHYAKNREFAWAYLEGLNGAGKFLAISVHLNNEKNTIGREDRNRVGRALTKWAKEMNKKVGLDNVPMILMGDFNSYVKREPKGMPYLLAKQGWLDTYNSKNDDMKFFEKAYTTSYTKGNQSGWPRKPITSGKPVRIDYIMYQGKGLRADIYAVVLKLKADGTFDNRYRGSDHMMVQSTIFFDAQKPLPSASQTISNP